MEVRSRTAGTVATAIVIKQVVVIDRWLSLYLNLNYTCYVNAIIEVCVCVCVCGGGGAQNNVFPAYLSTEQEILKFSDCCQYKCIAILMRWVWLK